MDTETRDMLKQQTAHAMESVWEVYDGTQPDLADAIDVDYSTVHRWTAGERVIRAENVVSISAETGVEKAAFRPDLFTG